MKQKIATAMSFVLMLTLAACGGAEQNVSAPLPETEIVQPSTDTEPETKKDNEKTEQGEPASTMNETHKIRFLVDGEEIIVQLDDNPTADALYEMLPIELEFEDYNGTEKITHPPEELPTDGAPDSCDPDVGDLCLYAPWGNLCFFYRDFRYSESLIPLGTVESGLDLLESLDTVPVVMVEVME